MDETKIETEKTEPTEQSIIDQLLKEKKAYEQSTSDQRQEIREIYDAYMGKMHNVVSLPYANQETIPKLRTEVSFIKPFIFSGEPQLEVEGIGDEDQAIAGILEKIVNFRLANIPDAYDKIEDWVHQAVTFGTSLIKVIWKFETKNNPDGTQSVVSDEPDLEVPNLLDVYYNPIVPQIKSQPSIICRSVLPLEEVKNNPAYDYAGQFGLNRERVEGKKNLTQNTYDSTSQMNTDTINNIDSTGLVEVFERYTLDRIQTVADGKEQLVLRDVENPYGFINLVKFVFEKNTIPNRFDGLGAGQNTKGLGTLFYRMMNQTLDNVTLTNNPHFLAKKNVIRDKKQAVVKPGGITEIDYDGPLSDSVQPLVFPDLKQGAIEILNKIDDEHKRASGANDLIQGAASNDTLGQDNLAQMNVSNRFELVVRRFKHAIADVGQMILDMDLKNLQSPDSPILRIFPEEMRMQIFQILINEAPNIKYNVKVKGDTNVSKNKDLQSKRLVDLFNLSGGFLTDKEKRAFLRRIAERQGEDNIDEIIMQNNPMADQMEQQNAMMQQAQTAMNPQMMPTPGTGINSMRGR